MAYRRQIGAIEKLGDLKPGDILLFRPAKQPFWSNSIIKFFQAVLSALDNIEQFIWTLLYLDNVSEVNTLTHGHCDTIHAAVCIGHNAKGEPVIAHSYEMGKDEISLLEAKQETPPWQGFVIETLPHMFNYEKKLNPINDERAFLTFRPKNPAAAKALADVMGDEKANNHIQWTYGKAAKTWTRPAFWRMAPDRPFKMDRKMPDTAICSELIISAIKKAEVKRLTDAKGETKAISDRINMQESSTPMALESYLYKDKAHYDLFIYAGKSAFEDLHKAILVEADRIERQNPFGPYASAKYRGIRNQCTKIKMWADSKECKANNVTKAITLLRIVMPMLNTPLNWYSVFKTTSYCNIETLARGMGIFKREFGSFSAEEKKAIEPLRLTIDEHEKEGTAAFFGLKKNGR